MIGRGNWWSPMVEAGGEIEVAVVVADVARKPAVPLERSHV